MILIFCITAVVIRKNHKRQSYSTSQQVIYDTPTVNTLQSNGSKEPNTSAALTSFPPLPTRNPVVQTSRQQTFNEDNPFNVEDNPAYQLAGGVHGGCQPNYNNVGGTSFK